MSRGRWQTTPTDNNRTVWKTCDAFDKYLQAKQAQESSTENATY